MLYRRFYEIWTKKEAYIKYLGKGLSLPLKSFDVLDESVDHKIQTIVMDGYIISVCTNEMKYKIQKKELSEKYIINQAREYLEESE